MLPPAESGEQGQARRICQGDRFNKEAASAAFGFTIAKDIVMTIIVITNNIIRAARGYFQNPRGGHRWGRGSLIPSSSPPHSSCSLPSASSALSLPFPPPPPSSFAPPPPLSAPQWASTWEARLVGAWGEEGEEEREMRGGSGGVSYTCHYEYLAVLHIRVLNYFCIQKECLATFAPKVT